MRRYPAAAARVPRRSPRCAGGAETRRIAPVERPAVRPAAATPFSGSAPSARQHSRPLRPSSWKAARVRRISPGSRRRGHARAQIDRIAADDDAVAQHRSPVQADAHLQLVLAGRARRCWRRSGAESRSPRRAPDRPQRSSRRRRRRRFPPRVRRPLTAALPSRSRCSCCSCRPAASPKRSKYGVDATMSEKTSSIWRSKRRVSSCCSWFCSRMMSVIVSAPRSGRVIAVDRFRSGSCCRFNTPGGCLTRHGGGRGSSEPLVGDRVLARLLDAVHQSRRHAPTHRRPTAAATRTPPRRC